MSDKPPPTGRWPRRRVLLVVLCTLPITCPGTCLVGLGLEYLRRLAFPLTDAQILLGGLPDGCEIVHADTHVDRGSMFADDSGCFEIRYHDEAALESLLALVELEPADEPEQPWSGGTGWWPGPEALLQMEAFRVSPDRAGYDAGAYVDRPRETVYVWVIGL